MCIFLKNNFRFKMCLILSLLICIFEFCNETDDSKKQFLFCIIH